MNDRHSWLDLALGLAASGLLIGMVLLTFADVLARYVFNFPIRGAFEITELALLTLIFAGMPLVSRADEHVTMDFIDRILSPRARGLLARAVNLICAALFFGMAWLVWVKAGKIAGYGDTTDVLKIVVAPFVYFMALMVAITGVVHLFRAFARAATDADGFDPDKVSTT